jgi:hypothetical protein
MNDANIKRIYHPLVLFFYYSKLLSKEQLIQIPKTTKDYWNTTNHTGLYGYDWISSFYTNYDDFNAIQKHKIIFKSARLCCRVFDTFSILCKDIKGYKRVLKNNVAAIIDTIDYLASDLKMDKACSIFNITSQQYYRFKNKVKCTASVLNLCFKTHPNQLTIAECSAIKEAVNDPANERKKLATIYYKLMRDGKLYCSRSTLYKYAKLVSEHIKKIKYTKPKQTIVSSRIFEYIHIDTTFLPTIKDGSVRGIIIKDNFSKKDLHWGIADNGDSKWVAILLKEMFAIYGLQNHRQLITIVSDGGSENKGEVIDWIDRLDSTSVIKKIAKTREFAFTNNEIESTFNIFKNEFLMNRNINDKEQVKKLLSEFQLYNDNERYPIALHGLTPQEVFDGVVIDKNRFKEQIKQTAKSRHLKNKTMKFCDVCS